MSQKCRAHNKQGVPCGRMVPAGALVCRWHGGMAPQTRQKQEQRLATLVDPALARLARLLHSKSPQVALAAVKDVLDRNGFKTAIQVQGEHEVILRVVRTEQPIVVQTRSLNGR